MSSSTSNSEGRFRDQQFLAWILVLAVAMSIVGNCNVWTGLSTNHLLHQEVGRRFGSEVDYIIMGDSKTGPFSIHALAPYLSKKGLVFRADSTTPVYHLYNYRKLRQQNPDLRPKHAFICIGANNFNSEGLHCRRDLTLFTSLGLSDVYKLTAENGQYLTFVEALLSRIFPLYGHRVQVTHFQFSLHPTSNLDAKLEHASWDMSDVTLLNCPQRDAVMDRNYLEIYRRSVLRDYHYSKLNEIALSQLIDELRAGQTQPYIVLLPVTEEMMRLEQELVGDRFMKNITAFATEKQVAIMDLRHRSDYNFEDVNHLSPSGAVAFAWDYFEPIISESAEPGPGRNLSQQAYQIGSRESIERASPSVRRE